ncbi:hypothetical protein BJX65DRAFT_260592 [Aspergillus insuetus]
MSSGHHLSYHISSLLLPRCRSQSSSRVPVVLLAKKRVTQSYYSARLTRPHALLGAVMSCIRGTTRIKGQKRFLRVSIHTLPTLLITATPRLGLKTNP